jgi:hypothetical protein
MAKPDATIAFWVDVGDHEKYKYRLKWRTLIQGDIGFGGLIACDKKFFLGCFDEGTGEFKSFGINLMSLRTQAEESDRQKTHYERMMKDWRLGGMVDKQQPMEGISNGWHHIIVRIKNYGCKKSGYVDVFVNGVLTAKRIYVMLKSNPKFIGNGATR